MLYERMLVFKPIFGLRKSQNGYSTSVAHSIFIVYYHFMRAMITLTRIFALKNTITLLSLYT